MKKAIFIFALLLIAVQVFPQKGNTSKNKASGAPKDSITALDISKHVYLLSVDIYEYNAKCYADSLPIQEFYGRNVTASWWREKGRYYWHPMDELPKGVKYLHWQPTWSGFIEYLTLKYGQK